MTQLKDGGRQPSNREERSLSASTVIARWQGNGWDEPCKSRGLRTVLWAAGGEIPPADPAAWNPEPRFAPFPLHRQQPVAAVSGLAPDRLEEAHREAVGIGRTGPQGIAAGDGGQPVDRGPTLAQYSGMAVWMTAGCPAPPASPSCRGRRQSAPAGRSTGAQAVQGGIAQRPTVRHPVRPSRSAARWRGSVRRSRRPRSGRSAVAEPERQAVEVGGEPEQVDLAAVGLGVAAGGIEFTPEGPGPAERVGGQGGVKPPQA